LCHSDDTRADDVGITAARVDDVDNAHVLIRIPAADLRPRPARSVALVGEPGIGKTRLTVEAAARATELGFVACWGRAWEAGGAPPYWPWRQLLDALPGIDRDGALAQLWGRGNLAAADRDQARFALFEAVAAAVRRASASSAGERRARFPPRIFSVENSADELCLSEVRAGGLEPPRAKPTSS
jgi:hypothetical protein